VARCLLLPARRAAAKPGGRSVRGGCAGIAELRQRTDCALAPARRLPLLWDSGLLLSLRAAVAKGMGV